MDGRCEETVKCLLMSLLQSRQTKEQRGRGKPEETTRQPGQADPEQTSPVEPRRAWKSRAEPWRKVGQDRAGQGKVAWRSWQTCMKTVR